jgi:hypothetical protein
MVLPTRLHRFLLVDQIERRRNPIDRHEVPKRHNSKPRDVAGHHDALQQYDESRRLERILERDCPPLPHRLGAVREPSRDEVRAALRVERQVPAQLAVAHEVARERDERAEEEADDGRETVGSREREADLVDDGGRRRGVVGAAESLEAATRALMVNRIGEELLFMTEKLGRGREREKRKGGGGERFLLGGSL